MLFYCDECEAEIEVDSYPEHVTDGDHFWCDRCWSERADKIRERAELLSTCPDCGATGDDLEDNGEQASSPHLTMLCLACNHEWDPNDSES